MLSVSENSLYDLEWDRLIDALAGHTGTLRGRARCLSLPFYDSLSEAEEELRRVEEYRELLKEGGAPSLAGVSSDAAEIAIKARKDAILDISELVGVAATVEATNRIATHIYRRREQIPSLADLCEGLTSLTEALDAIRYAIDPDRGELLDRASSELGPLRKKVRNMHGKVKRKLESMLSDPALTPLLRDTYYTIREDRYVLPVRVNEKSGVKGIVHGSSGTGRTVFIEPRELVAINNDLSLSQMEVEREERRILRNLSAAVAAEGPTIRSNLDVLELLDVVGAKACLADSLHGTAPSLTDEQMVDLRQARHPLLALKTESVVPNDLELGVSFNALVLSGANTGGKTVALKTIGLSVMMAWCGMPIPAQPGSKVGRFERILTVMGDEQSLSDDLSTFSANIRNLNHVLDESDSRSLILLDEIVVGTDPRQGAALAQSLVESMADQGARIIVTTHYDRLKRLAHTRDDFKNAAVGLSDETLTPSYIVTIGIPGASAAFRIASELGVRKDVVQRAEAMVDEDSDALDAMVQRLQEEVEEQRRQLRQVETTRRDLDIARQTYERKLKLVESRERQELDLRRKDVLSEIEKTREEVREIIRSLQKGADMAEATRRMERLREMEEEARRSLKKSEKAKEKHPAPNEPERKNIDADDLEQGMEVFIANLAQRGVVVETSDRRNMALVEVGRLKMRIPTERLRALLPHEKRPVQKNTGSRKKLAEALSVKASDQRRDPSITCDLRGERVDEALDMVDTFLDRAMRQGSPFVYFIHGHGTGRLKKALRAHLRSSPYLKSFRPGERGEGQDGVTVAILSDK